MNVDTLVSQVRYRIGLETDTKLDTPILHALNTIQRENILSIDFQELMTHDKTSLYLAASTTNYDLPSDFLKMYIVWNNDQYTNELVRITPRKYKNYLGDVDTVTGTYPQFYDILDSSSNVKQIYLFPLRSSVSTGSITAFANYNGTVAGTVKATDASHGLATGNTITIAGSTNFNDTYTITYIDVNNFYFTATWVSTASETGTWTRIHYVPFVYIKKLDDLTAGGSANILTTYYEDLYIDGATYIMYRDHIYRDQPEKIAFRRGEYDKQIEIIRRAQRQPDRISKVTPKRILPTRAGRLFKVGTNEYTW